MPAMEALRSILLTGPAGTGKTTRCIRWFREQLLDSPYSGLFCPAYFVLPSKEHSERIHSLFLRDPGFRGLANLHVVSMGGFIRMKSAFEESRVLTRFERYRIIESLLTSRSWSFWEEVKDTAGLAEILSDWIREVKQTTFRRGHWASALKALSVRQKTDAARFADMDRLLKLYDERVRALGLIDPEAETFRFARRVGRARAAALSDLVILDGFFSFTPAQLEFVRSVARNSQRTIVTLTLDASGNRSDVFGY
ncbi:MAG: hypothetical protein HQL11_05830, partial [Candidatus Omnitrophica bacterium]|nr:hypothetical protein [Candidatus Omnitrophota bacterium]